MREEMERRGACFKFVEVFFFFNSFFFIYCLKRRRDLFFSHCPAVAVCKGIRQG